MDLASCRAIAPAFACQNTDVLVYLIPSFAMAVIIRLLASAGPGGFIFLVLGTFCHEGAHALVGLLTNARPRGFTIWPERSGPHRWRLGSVTFHHITWYNAAPAALAPLLLLVIPFAVAWWRTRHPWHFQPRDLLLTLLIAPQLLSFWPSVTDWKVAARSWPYLFIIGGVWWWRFKM